MQRLPSGGETDSANGFAPRSTQGYPLYREAKFLEPEHVIANFCMSIKGQMIAQQCDISLKESAQSGLHHRTDCARHVIPKEAMMNKQHISLSSDSQAKTFQVSTHPQSDTLHLQASDYLHAIGTVVFECVHMQICIQI